MRKVLIVGGGTSGLQLAHGLLHHGYDVTVINGSSSQEIRSDKPSITQFTLPSALAHEQAAGLAMWEHIAPRITGATRSEEHTSELQSRGHLVCRLLLEKK